MTEEFGTEVEACLDELMDPHIAAQMATADAVRAWDDRRTAGEVTSVTYANGLLGVARHEEAGRLAIVKYRPRDERESTYLFATRGTLNANEMTSALE